MPKASLSGKTEGRSLSNPLLRTWLNEDDVRDLHVIWGRDQRIPTPSSRHKWAQHRGLAPSTVGGWFSRRRARHIRLGGSDDAVLTGSYELNPSSPSNVAPHEMPEKVQVRGSRARARTRTERGAQLESGSDRTDPDPSSDDLLASYDLGGLDQEALADAMEGRGALPISELLCRGDCILCVSAPPSPPKLWLPWSTETAEQPNLGLIGNDALESILSGLPSLHTDSDNL